MPYEYLQLNYKYYTQTWYPWFFLRKHFDIICLHYKRPYKDNWKFSWKDQILHVFFYISNYFLLYGKYIHLKTSIMSQGTIKNLKIQIWTCNEACMSMLVKSMKRVKVLILWIDWVQLKNSFGIIKHGFCRQGC
jgi:hypothetical protein